jgi:hypothetical protein
MSRFIKNTSYKVQVDVDTDEIRNAYKIEEGAFVTTESGVWTVYNGEWVKLHPQSGIGSGLGWTRYDDGQYTSASKLSLALDTEVTLPNNGATVYRSYTGIDYYNGATNKVLADNENDVYVFTVVFKASTPNANQTFLRLQLDAENGTPYRRVGADIPFPKGNDVTHEEHLMVQYYADSNFVANGSEWKITATGGTAKIWDIIYFIQKTQSYA